MLNARRLSLQDQPMRAALLSEACSFCCLLLGNRPLTLNGFPHTAVYSKLPFPLDHQEAGQESFIYHSHVSTH